MPRVIEHPDGRRAEMLDRAAELFVQRGYDNVSLTDRIAHADVSKGAFYHWFPSKDALAGRSAVQVRAAVAASLAECSGNALDGLNAVLQAGFDVKMRMGTPEHLGGDGVVVRAGKRAPALTNRQGEGGAVRPLLTKVITDGVAEGVFDTFDPEGIGEMIQALAARTT